MSIKQQVMDAGSAVLVMTRTFDASPQAVFAAWTEPAHLARWWSCPGGKIVETTVDLRIGGIFRQVMRLPDGEEIACQGEFVEIEPPSRIVYRGDPSSDHACGAGLPPAARIEVLIEADPAGAKLTLYTEFADKAALEAANAEGYSTSWAGTLDAFKAYVEERA